jgi:hypothetical protein
MSHNRDEDQSAASRWMDDQAFWSDELDLRELDTLFMHVQLQQLFEVEAEREARIQRVLSANQELLATQSVTAKPKQKTQPHTRRSWDRRWTLAVAASLFFLCTFGLLTPTQESSALAAIEKAIIASQQTVTRKYAVFLKIGPMGRELNVDLFSQGKTDFRVELKNFPIQPAVIGGNAETRWAIIGTKRWDSNGEASFPLDDTLDQVSLRFLILHDVISSIPSDYEYVKIQGRTPAGETLVTAKLKKLQLERDGSKVQLPDRVAVRIDDQSGVVKDLKLNWDNRELGLYELNAEYLGEVDERKLAPSDQNPFHQSI